MRKRLQTPWYFLLPAALAALGVLLPLGYLVVRAAGADMHEVTEIVLRQRNLELLINTVTLAVAVVAATAAVALPLAWLTTRTRIRGRLAITLFSVLPLSMPGYVVGYALLALGTPYGPLGELIGGAFPRLSGFTGAFIALTIYNFPFMYLNLRTALIGMDPSLADAARSLGDSAPRAFIRVTLPQLRPAFLSGAMLVGLYVFGDFGVVSLMRFETFSYAIYLQYIASYDRIYAAWLALMLLGLTTMLVAAEFRLLRDLSIERTGLGTAPERRLTSLGRWRFAAYPFVVVVAFVSVVLPIWVILFWLGNDPSVVNFGALASALGDSLRVSIPAAAGATLLAVPLAYLSRRHPTAVSQLMERAAYVGYATPALAFALGLIFLSLNTVPWVYQTAGLVIFAYTMHFLAQAVGPVRAGLYLATPRIEEASRSLGFGALATFRRITLPILRPGLVAACALVFLSCIKELPLTFLLAPLNFETLALNVYGYATEAMFAEAAPYALVIVLISTALATVLFRHTPEAT